MSNDVIYDRPHDYDLEHEGDDADVAFYLGLARKYAPRRLLELACGSGRVTVPLARLGARAGFDVIGVDLSDTMLDAARGKRAAEPEPVRDRMSLASGDLRNWEAPEPVDLIVSPCSSLSHLLTLDDQIATWRQAWRNLAPGGRFVAEVSMPDLAAFADSMRTPSRVMLELDIDARDERTGERMLRYKATSYSPHQQRASIRFLYDKFADGQPNDRYVSDFECHVYHPRELQLLFLHTGFTVEAIWGDYNFTPLSATSVLLIVAGRKR